MKKSIYVLLPALALVLAGCGTTRLSRHEMILLQPPPWETGTEAAVRPPQPSDNPALDRIDREQRQRRRQQVLLARQKVVLGRRNYSDKEYKKAIDQFTGAEVELRAVSLSTPTATRDLEYVRQLLAATYRSYALFLIEKAKRQIERARDELDISMLKPAETYLARAVEYDNSLAAEAKRLNKKIKRLEFQIEIEIRTRPSVILRQLGNVEQEFQRKLVARRMKWLAAKADPSREAVNEVTEEDLAELQQRYELLRRKAGSVYGEDLVSYRFLKIPFEKGKPYLALDTKRAAEKPDVPANRQKVWKVDLSKAGISPEPAAKRLQEIRKAKADTLREYAKQLIDQARGEVDTSKLERAKSHLAKAIELDQSLIPDAERLLKRIEQLRVAIEIQERTGPDVIDPDYQERIKEILVKKAEAKVFMDHNVWKRARDAYEDVLLKDPADEDAINGLRQLYETLQEAAKLRRRAGEAERMAETEWKWMEPVPSSNAKDGKGGVHADKKPEQIDVDAIILRRRQQLLVERWRQEGRELAKAGKHKQAVDKFAQAETILKQQSKSSKSVNDDLDATRKELALAHLAAAAAAAGGGKVKPDEVVVVEKRAFWKLMSKQPHAAMVAVHPKTKVHIPLPLTRTVVRGKVSSFVAHVQVKQLYDNPYSEKIEAVYVFPLPQNAAVTDFVMTIGKRTIRGMIREKEEAKRVYNDALQQGYKASLLTQERPNIFKQKVANIEPGDEIDVAVTYFNTLKYAKGEYEFVFPMVVGPRFNPPGFKDGIGAVARGTAEDSDQPTAVEYLAPNERSGHDIDLQVEIDAGVSIESYASPTHAIDVQQSGKGKLRVGLKPNDRIPNKDFVFRYKVAGQQLKTAFLHQQDKQAKTFSLVLVPPAKLTDVPVQPREMIFVVDCSGSMSGRPLEKAKQAMRRCLKNMDPRDSFQIIRFSESAFTFGKAPVPATKENIESGLKYIDGLHSGGGTMMIEGIKAALDMPHDKGRLRIVSFMTDGYIGNDQEILAAVKQKLGSARIFSFGVGSSVNRYLIEGMAREGRGTAAFVTLNEKPSRVVDVFYERAKHAALTDVKVDWSGLDVKEVYPKRLPDLFVGRPVTITGRYAGELPERITVSGMAGGKQVSYEVRIKDRADTHEGIRYVWARGKIGELAMANTHKPSKELQNELVRFSTEQNVLCNYTAFLAVDASRRTEGTAETMHMPVPMPDGVAYETTVK